MYIYSPQETPKSIAVISSILLYILMLGSRILIKFLLTEENFNNQTSYKKNALIYGAGEAGKQIAFTAHKKSSINILGFIDDNKQLHRTYLSNYKVYHSSELTKLVISKKIDFILLAIPSISKSKKSKIIEKLSKHNLVVRTVPTIDEIVNDKVTILDMKDLDVEDLLNRDTVEADIDLLNQNTTNKTVLVTGAGGSIGSELCMQIMISRPKKLLLLEFNEFALYQIYEKLKKNYDHSKIFPCLIDVQNQEKLSIILEEFKVETVYHAAAYKHVTLVEKNICAAIRNNVFGTVSVIKACINNKVSSLVLVSSDKAVRPTNIMGATKRLSELYMQGIYNDKKNIFTNFSIVRFGNVLESSGSAIPKFKNQIKNGDYVTLTHQDITRYFMTVKEASQLVIQAGSLGQKSEVFVLDMGPSVKIKELVCKMIKLYGLTVKDKCNPDGDIEIKIIGLGPGEKLHEELLIGNNPQPTKHPKIMKISEDFIPFDQLEIHLKSLESMLDNNEVDSIKNLFETLNIYYPNSQVVDHLYIQQLTNRTNTYNL